MGARFNENIFRQTSALYAPMHCSAVMTGAVIHDVAYGPHERHRMDLYLSDDPHACWLIFVHGGGFVGGDKCIDGPFYSNVGHFFARNGFVCAVINYRLAPSAPWPAGAEDIERALNWLSSHASLHGARTAPLFIVGQSAGATHVASWLSTADRRSASIGGVALLSGFYHLRDELTAGQTAYFGTSTSTYESRSPLNDVARWGVPILLTVAEYDPPATVSQSLELAKRLTVSSARAPDFARFHGHNHVSTVMSLGTEDRQVGDCLLRFFKAYRSIQEPACRRPSSEI